jgi:hypothetical protein
MIYYPVGMPVGSSGGDLGLEVTVCMRACWLSSSSGACLVITLGILIERGLVSCEGDLGAL